MRKDLWKAEVSILGCLRNVNFFIHEIFWSQWLRELLPASKCSDIGGSRGSPGPGLAAAGNWWCREALRADTGRNNLYCRAKETSLIRSDSLQLAGGVSLSCCSWGPVCSEHPGHAVFPPAGSSCPAVEVHEEQEGWACLPSSAHLRAAKCPAKKALGDSVSCFAFSGIYMWMWILSLCFLSFCL